MRTNLHWSIGVLSVLLAAGSTASRADEDRRGNDGRDLDSRLREIRIGYDNAPVSLYTRGKNPLLIGLGSYIVNVVSECNGCHSAGPPTQYIGGSNPYFRGQIKAVDPSHYLGGGRVFSLGPNLPAIVSRNLTPDKTGRPEGGRTFDEFLQIFRTGIDFDKLHPNCTATLTTNCFPAPWDGTRLQVMPWPAYQDFTTQDIRAIYEYLSAIPCIEGPKTGILHNDCH